MPRRLQPEDCEAVVVNGGNALHLCETLIADQPCPVLLVVHAPVRRMLEGHGGEERRQIFLRRTRFVSGMAFVSRIVEEDWREAGLVQDKPTFYLSNCCDEEQVERVARRDPNDLRRELGLPLDREIVLCLGRPVTDKGQDLVVAEMPALLRQRPDLHVIFVGRITDHWGSYDDQWGPDLVAQVEASDFADRCWFLGEKSNAMEYLRAADLLVLPSRSEALPLVLLEAMALGLPVVASAIDGNAEAVIDGETGLLFPSEDSAAMTVALVRQLAEPEPRKAMAEAGRARYWSDFSQASQGRKLADILQQLAG